MFRALLGPFDEACKAVICARPQSHLPARPAEQRAWFETYLPSGLEKRSPNRYNGTAKKLKQGLVCGNAHSVIGLLRSCLDHALNDSTSIDGVFKAGCDEFRFDCAHTVKEIVSAVNTFRNTYVAHGENELRDGGAAERNLRHWVTTLAKVAAL